MDCWILSFTQSLLEFVLKEMKGMSTIAGAVPHLLRISSFFFFVVGGGGLIKRFATI